MFMVAARELADGARMYGEYWDMKQPGIYWWYLATGHLFSFTPLGLRYMDILWSVCAAAIIWLLLRPRGAATAVLGPCFTFGGFYAAAGAQHLSQVEWLVCGPLALIAVCINHTEDSSMKAREFYRYALAGAMLCVVGLFKTLLVPVAGAMLAVALGHAHWSAQRSWPELLRRRVVPVIAGGVAVLVPIVVWMAVNGTLKMAVWTTLIYPGAAVSEYRRQSVHMLVDSFTWFASGVWTLLPPAMWAVFTGLRRGRRLELTFTAWAVAALASISAQVLSYWQYHFDLLFMPVGLLAALGVVDLLDRLTHAGRSAVRRAVIAALVLAFSANLVWPLARKIQVIAATHAFDPANERAFEVALDPRMQKIFNGADTVRPLVADAERIVVWGDPRLYFFVGRRPVVEVDGATFYLAGQLEEAAEVIRERRPRLVYLSKYRDHITYHGTAAIPRVVKENYVPCYESDAGIWYRLREDRPI